eukprot:CAMPEP_0118979804 /NCGR_PEP_ID=MMETSP1173-20130426/26749_1 /TAXON_ID=1034831 /ORGANISM="Rhizochromulina marina cf, Strain CCMP1243" /LENGTH=174 /DNA_ID=CAMNT_0006930087 /DNA_START=121 /DNA_END=645 /DNA_ORIENTATION=-
MLLGKGGAESFKLREAAKSAKTAWAPPWRVPSGFRWIFRPSKLHEYTEPSKDSFCTAKSSSKDIPDTAAAAPPRESLNSMKNLANGKRDGLKRPSQETGRGGRGGGMGRYLTCRAEAIKRDDEEKTSTFANPVDLPECTTSVTIVTSSPAFGSSSCEVADRCTETPGRFALSHA